jgi:hypothetical protein
MSSQYRKIEYETEGAYGSTEKEWLYIWSHDTVDITHVYDQYGDELFCYSETGFDMGDALNVVFTDWNDERLIPIGYQEFNEIRELQKEEVKDWKKLWVGFERKQARRKVNKGSSTLLGVRPCSECGITSTSWVNGDDYSKGVKFVGDVCEYCIVDNAHTKHNTPKDGSDIVIERLDPTGIGVETFTLSKRFERDGQRFLLKLGGKEYIITNGGGVEEV